LALPESQPHKRGGDLIDTVSNEHVTVLRPQHVVLVKKDCLGLLLFLSVDRRVAAIAIAFDERDTEYRPS
jgi:hypothetical protein